MPVTRRVAEREIQQCLTKHEDIRNLLRHGGSEGVRRFAQVVSSCVEKLNAEAGLTGLQAVFVTSAVMQGALPSMLLFREGEIRAASQAVSTLWIELSTGESAEQILAKRRGAREISAPVRGAAAKLPKILAKRRDERELEELAHVFPLVVFEEAASARKATSGRDMLRRVSACLELSFENVGRVLNVPGETVRRWERGISRIPSDALATLELVDSALTRLTRLFLPQRLPEVVRRKAELFDGSRALDWILQGRISDVVDRYERALSYQG